MLHSNKELSDLLELSKTLEQKIKVDSKIVDVLLDNTFKNAPSEMKGFVEKAQHGVRRAMELVKEEKHDESKTIINNLMNECRNNK